MFKKCAYLLLVFVTFTLQSQRRNLSLKSEAPDFKLWLLDDSIITKDSIKNKVVVFKFWFTTCPPCIDDIPRMNSLVKEFSKRDDILFIAPALDQKHAVKKLLKRFPFRFKVAYNSYDVSALFNKKQVYPSYFIIDKKGKLAFIDSSSREPKLKDLRKAVIKALKI